VIDFCLWNGGHGAVAVETEIVTYVVRVVLASFDAASLHGPSASLIARCCCDETCESSVILLTEPICNSQSTCCCIIAMFSRNGPLPKWLHFRRTKMAFGQNGLSSNRPTLAGHNSLR